MKRLFWIAILAAGLLQGVPASAQWVAGQRGHIPVADGPTGRQDDGRPLWVCRAWYNGGLHPGKVRPGFRGCNIGWGGEEHAIERYEVLAGGAGGYAWVRAQRGFIPDFAIAAGRDSDGRTLFVCRARYRNGVHPGKIYNSFGGCNIGWGGREPMVTTYEVLVSSWRPVPAAEIQLRRPCGVANSGRIAWVVNLRKDRRVRVTVRRTVAAEPARPQTQEDFVYILAAGGQRGLGCNGRLRPSERGQAYSLAGAEVL